MVQQEYIDKFEKIISFYNIDKSKIYDIARAISFAESFGTHPISINDLSKCGVDYFKEITNAPKAKELPDTRIMRMMCDTLTIALFTIKDDLFSNSDILSLLSDNVCGVLSEVDSKKHNRGSNHYKTVEECKQVLDKYISFIEKKTSKSIGDISKFLDFVTNVCSNHIDFKGLVLNSDYQDAFENAYFSSSITYRDIKENFMDSLTNYLLDSLLTSRDRLRASLLISTKSRGLNLGQKVILKVSPDKYRSLRADSFIINALNSVFTFTHADSIQNIDSLIILYALLYEGVDKMSKVKDYIGG